MNEFMGPENKDIELSDEIIAEAFSNEVAAMKNFEGVENEAVRTRARLAQFNSEMLQKVREGLPAVDPETMARRQKEVEKFKDTV